ncbi:unknown [Lactococcus phage Q54]|uniref:Uncharacterized protein n=1 Tax=Lactococcus phage Q54 TaxID=382685 RepID=Q0GXT7_9CAUD|nr:hypothetical protein Q54_gp35 [Lactococcus phage Q54]ABF22589.1 unknown [Lactococcus phage Q54]
MKVSELIEKLKEMPQDLNVMLFDHEYWQHYPIKNAEVTKEEYDTTKNEIVEIN